MSGFIIDRDPPVAGALNYSHEDNIVYDVQGASYRNLKPGETRPVRAIVPFPAYPGLMRNVRGVPQGWRLDTGYPDSVEVGFRVTR
jgi:hypothetical protein